MTEEQLKNLLDQQAKIITGQLTKHFDERLNTERITAYGQMTRHLDDRLDAFESRVTGRIDQLQITIDGIAQRLDTFEQEQTIINARTDSKLDQLAEATSIKWATE